MAWASLNCPSLVWYANLFKFPRITWDNIFILIVFQHFGNLANSSKPRVPSISWGVQVLTPKLSAQIDTTVSFWISKFHCNPAINAFMTTYLTYNILMSNFYVIDPTTAPTITKIIDFFNWQIQQHIDPNTKIYDHVKRIIKYFTSVLNEPIFSTYFKATFVIFLYRKKDTISTKLYSC